MAKKAAPTAPAALKGSARLDAFRNRSEEQAQRIPSATVTIEEGQYIAGRVLRRATYRHEAWGVSPVIVFDPEEQDTNVAGTIDGTPVTELEAGTALVFVGIGTVSSKLAYVRPDDLLYILGLPKGESAVGVYANYEFVISRDGAAPRPLQELIDEADLMAKATGKAAPAPVAQAATVPDEEPF